jgi:hypothetical protein
MTIDMTTEHNTRLTSAEFGTLWEHCCLGLVKSQNLKKYVIL